MAAEAEAGAGEGAAAASTTLTTVPSTILTPAAAADLNEEVEGGDAVVGGDEYRGGTVRGEAIKGGGVTVAGKEPLLQCLQLLLTPAALARAHERAEYSSVVPVVMGHKRRKMKTISQASLYML